MPTKERKAAQEITIRRMAADDAEIAAELSAELGYPVSSDVMRQRLEHLGRLADHALFAASAQGRVVGWIDVGIAQHLLSGRYGEIGGLVVSAAYRGQGIGRQLVACAEQWIATRGVTETVVRSRVSRGGAHAFYLALDYQRVKTSVVFAKSLKLCYCAC